MNSEDNPNNYFVIVEFPKEKKPGETSVPMEIISSTWIIRENNEDFCTWPTYMKFPSGRNKAIRNHLPIKIDSCDKTSINIKYETDDFEKAMKKIEQLTEKTDISSTASETEILKKKRIIRKPQVSSSDSESDSSNLPLAPKPKRNNIFSPTSSSVISCLAPVQEDDAEEQTSRTNSPLSTQSRSESIRGYGSPLLTQGPRSKCNNNNACSCTKNTVLIEKLFTSMEKISEDVKYIIRMMQEQNMTADMENIHEKFDILCTEDDLEKFNGVLSDSTEFSNMCKVFQTVGGKDHKETTRRILSKMISNDLAKKANWTGLHECVKFQQYENIINLVVVSVRRNPCSKAANKKDIEMVIKSWLRYAADREGGRMKRTKQNQINLL